MSDIILYENIREKIITLRSQRVLLDRDLAGLYGIETRILNQAVKRNIERFPGDFMFQLNEEEAENSLRSQNVILKNDENLKSQFATSSPRSQIATLDDDQSLRSQIVMSKRGKHLKYLPFAFTEQGIAMLSSVLKSKKAVEINIAIMRVFVMVARIIDSSKSLAEKIEEIKKEQEIYQNKNDKNIKGIFSVINYLTEINKEDIVKEEIGFKYKT